DYEDRDQERALGGYDDNDDDDDDDDDEEEDGISSQTPETRKWNNLFRQAREEILEKNGKFQDPEVLGTFLSKYRDVIGEPVENQKTSSLLHRIVDMVKHNNIRSSDIRPLVHHIVNKCPSTLRVASSKGENPLYLAIGYKKWMLVEYMVDGCSNPEYLADAIAGPCKSDQDKTSLHLALEKDLRPHVTEKLIRGARDDGLGKKDKAGKTPLHYAVNYAQCSDERVKIIDLFIARDKHLVAKVRQKNPNEPVKTFLDEEDHKKASVYRQLATYIASSLTPAKTSKAGAGEDGGKKQVGTGRIEAEDQSGSVRRPDPKSADRQKDSKVQTVRDGVRGRAGPGENGRQSDDRDRDAERGDRRGRQQEEKRREEMRLMLREKEARERDPRGRDQDVRSQVRGSREDESRDARDFRQEDTVQPKGPVEVLRSEPLQSPNTSLKRAPTWRRSDAIGEAKKEGKPTKKKSEKTDPESLARNSKAILARLKLHYMRTRNTERATTFLYGKNVEGIHICFEYDKLPREIKEETFVKGFGEDQESGIKFDEILRHVSFPEVVVKRKPGRNLKVTGAAGRHDMEFFFQWLYKKVCNVLLPFSGMERKLIPARAAWQGVRHIIKVTVDDTSIPAHGDEAIQTSLEKIVVEQLNWSKVDLDPRTICRIGTRLEKEPGKFVEAPSQLTEVALRWSGNNAVLRAWSEREGLSLLPNLSRIYLHMPPVTETCDSQQWVNKNVSDFEERLNENIRSMKATLQASLSSGEDEIPKKAGEATPTAAAKPADERPPAGDSKGDMAPPKSVDVFPITQAPVKSQRAPDGSRFTGGATSPSTQSINSHQWLDCMDTFASKFKPFWEQTLADFLAFRSQRAGETAKGLEKDVVVALIDDGVDSCDDDLAGRILPGKTFDYQDDGMRPHFVSATGHGTAMASMITRVCPMAKIYPIRLKMQQDEKGEPRVVMKSAALAIEAALDRRATIISMSWTVPVQKESSQDKAHLEAVLERAVASDTLMFCSSPDSGQFTSKDYPTAYNRDRFFRIGAANDDGSVFRWTGTIDSLDFILPGVDVVRNHSTNRLPDRVKEMRSDTGSSVATALAAGLAATIIYCVKASAMGLLTAGKKEGGESSEFLKLIPPAEADRIAKHANMKQAFPKLGKLTKERFIPVWESLSPVNEVFNNDFADPKKLEVLVKFVMALIPQ
ncbi:hypothetical protein QBC33DRAFT_600247, partial [Phialemonium atrogriseum]